MLGACLLGTTDWAARELAGRSARSDLERQAQSAAALHAAVLRSELEKHRSLPFVLAEDSDVRYALSRNAPETVAELNAKLEKLSDQTRAAAIYILQPDGVTIASSNYRLPTSFVGSDYSFRPYFKDAIRAGTAEDFALGTVSRRPGLYLARRVEGPAGPLGIVVVKVEFDALEAEWRASGEPAYVTDGNGIVLVTSVADWRFHTVNYLPEAARGVLRATLQYGGQPLSPLPLRKAGRGQVEDSARPAAGRFISASTPAAGPNWRLHLLTPSDRTIGQAQTGARAISLLLTATILLATGMLLRRQERGALVAAAQEAARIELEARVEARTTELRSANEHLVHEMEERRRAEASLLLMQDGLVQANKLATLGQIAAGVAHEINQPVAAIRTYADNAIVFLDRGQPDPVRENLGVIASLTERIGLITNELRDFARKSTARPQPVCLEDVIAGAVLLIGSRARRQGVVIAHEGDPRKAVVLAERARLQQVLVNLLQNALEALEGKADGAIRLNVELFGRKVKLTVSDNGPGLSPDTAANLFTPFVTTKASGLGLGLVISRDIVTEFGGDLSLKAGPHRGAIFVISLKRAI